MARYSPTMTVTTGPGTADNPTINITYSPNDGTAPQAASVSHARVNDPTATGTFGLGNATLPAFGLVGTDPNNYSTTFLGRLRSANVEPNDEVLVDFYDHVYQLWQNSPYNQNAPDFTNVNIEIVSAAGDILQTIPVTTRNIWRPAYTSIPAPALAVSMLNHNLNTPKVYFDSNGDILVFKMFLTTATDANGDRYAGSTGDFYFWKYTINTAGSLSLVTSGSFPLPGTHAVGNGYSLPPTEHVAFTYSKTRGLIFVFSGPNPTDDYVQIVGDPETPNTSAPRIPIATGRNGYSDPWENKTFIYGLSRITTAGRLYSAEVITVPTSSGDEEVLVLQWTDPIFSTGVPIGVSGGLQVGSPNGASNTSTTTLYPMFRLDGASSNNTTALPTHYIEHNAPTQAGNSYGLSAVTRHFYDPITMEIVIPMTGSLFSSLLLTKVARVSIGEIEQLKQSLDVNTVYFPSINLINVTRDSADNENPAQVFSLISSGNAAVMLPNGEIIMYAVLKDNPAEYPYYNGSGVLFVIPNEGTATDLRVFNFATRDLPTPGQPMPTTGNIRPHGVTTGPYYSVQTSVTPDTDTNGRWAIVGIEDAVQGTINSMYLAVYPAST